jgi:hypothetical protein
MTNPDLVTWANTTAGLVTAQLPLQSLQSAVDLAFAYITDVGGWVPDDPANANGPGLPANGASEQTGANDITSQQIGDVYDLKFSVSVTLSCQFSQHLGTGLDLNAAAAAMVTDVTNLITNSINDSALPVRVDSVGTQTPDAGRSLLGGTTTETVRQDIAADVAGVAKVVDYKAIALKYATTVHALDDTWNVKYVYTQTGSPTVVSVQKYTDNTYATLDSHSTTVYLFTISPTTYDIVAGVTLNT